MDILQKYEQEHPVSVPQSVQRPQPEYGFFIRLVMKILGGKITNARQAAYVLLAVAAVILATSIGIVIWTSRGGSSAQNLIPNIDQRQFIAPRTRL